MMKYVILNSDEDGFYNVEPEDGSINRAVVLSVRLLIFGTSLINLTTDSRPFSWKIKAMVFCIANLLNR